MSMSFNIFEAPQARVLRERMGWASKMRPESVAIRSGFWFVTTYESNGQWWQFLSYSPRGSHAPGALITWGWSKDSAYMDEDAFCETARQRLFVAERMIESRFEA